MAAKAQTKFLTLIACGETTWGREGRLLGSADLPLSNAGQTQATTDADALAHDLGIDGESKTPPFAFIHHPADEAGHATAQTFARRLGCKTREVDELRDPHLGLLEGLTEQTFAERYPKRFKQYHDDPLSMQAPEGEEMIAARGRLFQAMVKILSKTRRSKTPEVAVVLHHLNLGMFRSWLAEQGGHNLWNFVENKPRVERYAVTLEQIQRLADEAQSAGLTS